MDHLDDEVCFNAHSDLHLRGSSNMIVSSASQHVRASKTCLVHVAARMLLQTSRQIHYDERSTTKAAQELQETLHVRLSSAPGVRDRYNDLHP
jgi:hypothetical protein